MPRGTYKTTIVLFSYMVRELLRNPLTASYALQLASFEKGTDWMMEIQSALEKPEITDLFGRFKNPSCWRKDKLILKGAPKTREGSVMIFGADQGMAGYHPKRVIFDDLHDDKNSQTKEQTIKIRNTFSRTITEVATKDTKCLMVATIYNREDSACKIIEDIEGISDWNYLTQKKYHKGKYWDIYIRQSVEVDPNGIPITIEAPKKVFRKWDKASLFFPENLSVDELNKKYASTTDDYSFACQFFNLPTLLENLEFTEEMLTQAKIKPDDMDIVGGLYLTMDPAYSVKKKSDKSAYIVCGFNKDGHLLIKLAHKERMDSRQAVETLFSLQKQWKPRVVGVEANSTQILLMSYIKELRRQQGLFFKITEVKTGTKGSKQDRIRKLLPYFKTGKIYIPEEFEEIYDELRAFPRGHDDLIDALSFVENLKRPLVINKPNPWEPGDEYFGNFGYTPFQAEQKGARF